MKRILTNLIPLGLLISAASLASAPPVPEEMPLEEKDRFTVGVEAHFFRPSQTELEFVESTRTVDGITFTQQHSLNPEFQFSGGRVFASYLFNDQNDIQLSWLGSSNNDSNHFAAVPNSDTITAFIDDFSGFYGSNINLLQETTAVKLKKKMEMNQVDLDMGHAFHDENYMLRVFAGVRYASLNDTLTMSTLYDTNTPTPHHENVVRGRSELQGMGPRGGFDAKYRLMDHLSLTGHAGAALLFSRINSHTHEHLDVLSVTPAPTQIHHRGTKIDRLVPNLDARLGLALDFMFDEGWGVVVEGGVHADHFFNASSIVLPSLNHSATRSVTRDVGEYGPYLGLSIMFS